MGPPLCALPLLSLSFHFSCHSIPLSCTINVHLAAHAAPVRPPAPLLQPRHRSRGGATPMAAPTSATIPAGSPFSYGTSFWGYSSRTTSARFSGVAARRCPRSCTRNPGRQAHYPRWQPLQAHAVLRHITHAASAHKAIRALASWVPARPSFLSLPCFHPGVLGMLQAVEIPSLDPPTRLACAPPIPPYLQLARQLLLVVVHEQWVGHHNQRLAQAQRFKDAARAWAWKRGAGVGRQ